MGPDHPNGAPPQDVAADTHDREIRGRHRLLGLAGLDVEQANRVAPDAAGHPATSPNRQDLAVVDTNTAAVEQDGSVAARPPGARLPAAEGEQPLALEKELALLREEQTEACEVDLFFVRLHLGEVCIDGEVRGQAAGQADLHVKTKVGGHVVRHHRIDLPVGRQGRGRKRLQLETLGAGGRVDAGERRGQREAIDRTERERCRNRAEMRSLVLPAHVALDVDAPHLLPCRAVAQRLERNRHLDGPAVLETRAARVPDGVPVAVLVAFVSHLRIAKGP